MEIQNLSVEVYGKCYNNCKFCVSKFYDNNYPNIFFEYPQEHEYIIQQYKDRLEYARQKGVDTIVLTGSSSDPIDNEEFLSFFNNVNKTLPSRFINIEIQTSGIGLTEDKLQFLEDVGVKTISFSIASFNDDINTEIMNTPEKLKINIRKTCELIKSFDMNLRLNLNLTPYGFGDANVESIVYYLKEYNVDQVTFRKLAYSGGSKYSKWAKENSMTYGWWSRTNEYIKQHGSLLNNLAFGAGKYSIEGISTVIDNDCLAQNNFDIRYLILKRNCKLYSRWNDPASLIF